jgi:hypothetical protein
MTSTIVKIATVETPLTFPGIFRKRSSNEVYFGASPDGLVLVHTNGRATIGSIYTFGDVDAKTFEQITAPVTIEFTP